MVEAISLSPAYRKGIREKGKYNPTAAYGELVLRDFGHSLWGLAATAGFPVLAGLMVYHDVMSHPIPPMHQVNELSSFLLDSFLNNRPAEAVAALSIPTAVYTAGNTVMTPIRTGQFLFSLGKDINSKMASRSSHKS